MGRKEDPMIWYYGQAKHFAELLNGWLFHGEKKLLQEHIHSRNTRYTKKIEKEQSSEYQTLYRDIVKLVENVQVRIIIGTEIQTYMDYSMPVRAMNYDVSDYKRQIDKISQEYKETHPKKIRMSPIGKGDRLIPTITLVLYLGTEPWDGAKNLHEILDFSKIPEEMKRYVADYPLYVLDVCHTDDARLLEFPRDIACMFLILKYRKDKKKLLEIIESHLEFQNVDPDMYDTVWKFTNEQWFLEQRKQLEEAKGGVNMCEAIRELVTESIEKGAEEATNRINKLTIYLLAEKRYDDLERAASDRDYQNSLFRVYGI